MNRREFFASVLAIPAAAVIARQAQPVNWNYDPLPVQKAMDAAKAELDSEFFYGGSVDGGKSQQLALQHFPTWKVIRYQFRW